MDEYDSLRTQVAPEGVRGHPKGPRKDGELSPMLAEVPYQEAWTLVAACTFSWTK